MAKTQQIMRIPKGSSVMPQDLDATGIVLEYSYGGGWFGPSG